MEQTPTGGTESNNSEEIEAVDGTPDYEEVDVAEQVRKPGEVPAMFRDDSQLDESMINQELGINIYTAPSISKIFNQLDDLPVDLLRQSVGT